MSDCIFCKIIAGEMPSYLIYEDSQAMAFLDIHGATDGHTIVVLKRHGETILNYSPEELKDLWLVVQKVTAGLEKAFATTILSIGINHGEPAGVHHLHVHVMPRFAGDGGGIIQSLPGKRLANKDFASVAKKIKDNIIVP